MRLVAAAVPPKHALVGVSLVGAKRMAALNRTYRDRRGITQILTFSYRDDPSDGLAPESTIGEIVLCWPPIAAWADERGVQPVVCLLRLLVHGLLHLKGYLHDGERAECAMERAEKRYLHGYIGEGVMAKLFA